MPRSSLPLAARYSPDWPAYSRLTDHDGTSPREDLGAQNLPQSFALSLQGPSKFGDLVGQLGEPPRHLIFARRGFVLGSVSVTAMQEALGQGAGKERHEAYASGHDHRGDHAPEGRRGVDVAVGDGSDGLCGPPQPVP